MARTLPVYRSERDAGLGPSLLARPTLAWLSPLVAAGSPPPAPVRAKALSALGAVPDSLDDAELFYMRDILCSCGWNLNDDVFDPVEMFAARHSSLDKPLNFSHDQLDIVGHIVASQAVDSQMEPIAEDTAAEDLPADFHIVNGSVIYRHIGGEARAEFIENLILEIEAKKWFVSMEAWFTDFDYAVRAEDGTATVVTRTASTAWMTKYLRAYPPSDPNQRATDPFLGTGCFTTAAGGSVRIGRLMRNLSFCGKGIVAVPGNPQSVILPAVAAFSPVAGTSVYLPGRPDSAASLEPLPVSTPSTDAAIPADLQAKLDALASTVSRLTAENETLRTASSQAAVAGALSDRDAAITRAEAAETQLAAITASHATTVTRAETAETALAAARNDLAEKTRLETEAKRMQFLAEKHCPEDGRAKLVADLAGLSDAAFESTISTLAANFSPPAPTTPPTTAIARVQSEPAGSPSAPLTTATPEFSAASLSWFESIFHPQAPE